MFCSLFGFFSLCVLCVSRVSSSGIKISLVINIRNGKLKIKAQINGNYHVYFAFQLSSANRLFTEVCIHLCVCDAIIFVVSFNAWIKLHTKKCPKCKSNIQKNGGCNHMACTFCKYEFCWLCFVKYKAGHFSLHPKSKCYGKQFT